MTAGLASEPKPIQHLLEFPLTRGRNEVEVTRFVKSAGVNLHCRPAGQHRGDSRRRQRVGDNRCNFLDGRRCAQLHQSALPLRRGRVRLRKNLCCSAAGKLSSATSSNARNGGTSGLRGFH